MVLPLSDAPNPRGAPFVTYALIAINVAIYLVFTWPLSRQAVNPGDPALRDYLLSIRDALPPDVPLRAVVREVSAYDLFVFAHGFRPAAPEALDLLTSIFLHAGFMHLFGNMLFLWIYGDNVEHRLGRVKFLFFYLLTGVAATLFYALFASGSKLPLVGASGAISGVLGFYFLWFPRNVVRLFVFLFPLFMDVVTVSARLVLGFYLVIDNLLPFLLTRNSTGGGVAYGAHIGGFLAGFAIAWLLDRREVVERPREFRAERAAPPKPPEIIASAIERGAMAEAARTYFALEANRTRRLLSPRDSLQLADWLAANGHAEAALTVYRRHLRDYPAGPGVAEAHLGAGLALLDAMGQVAPAYQHFLEALDANPSWETEERIRAALQRIRARQKFQLGHYSR